MDLEHLRTALYSAAYQLPLVVICIVCLAVLGGRWQQAGSGATWAAFGLGLAILLSVVAPFVQTAAIDWARQSGQPVADVANGVAFLFSFLRGSTYVLLLVGILAGRPATPGYPPPGAYR